MNETKLFNKVISTNTRLWVISLSLIITTPLCGFLFQCGCDWPWLDFVCNHYQPEAVHNCPWCASIFTGALSIGLALVIGLWFSLHKWPVFFKSQVCEIAARTMSGLLIFIFVAMLASVLSAFWQDYPLGIGHLFH